MANYSSIKLSVVMPAYNAAKNIHSAIRSSLQAMPKNSELIIIDDGSVDKTRDLVAEIKDSRLVLLSQQHSGIVAALNRGLQVARGDYLARMDSDDICLPWRFSRQLQYLESHPEIDFHFSPAIAFGKPVRPYFFLPQVPLSLPPEFFMSELMIRNPAVHPSMICKRNSLLELGGYENVPAEDENLWLRAAIRGMSLSRAAMPTILLRLHRGQTTRQESWKSMVAEDQHNDVLRSELRVKQEGKTSSIDVRGVRALLTKLDNHGLPALIAPWKPRR